MEWVCPLTKSPSGCLGPLTGKDTWYCSLSSTRTVSFLIIKHPVYFSLLRYMDQVTKLTFTRDAHVKKYKKLMKLDLPSELESLRWVGAQASVGQTLYLKWRDFMCIHIAYELWLVGLRKDETFSLLSLFPVPSGVSEFFNMFLNYFQGKWQSDDAIAIAQAKCPLDVV